MAGSVFEAPANFNVDIDCDRTSSQQQRIPYRQQYY
jgi:hypothetical protein